MLEGSCIETFLVNVLSDIKPYVPAWAQNWQATSFHNNEDGSRSITHGNRPDNDIMLSLLRNGSPAFLSFVSILTHDDLLAVYKKRYLDETGGNEFYFLLPDIIARYLLSSYLQLVSSLEPDMGAIHSISTAFSEGWNSGVSRMSVFSVVRGFYSEVDDIALENGISIRKLNNEEVVRLIEEQRGGLFFGDGLPENRYVVESIVDIPIGSSYDPTLSITDELDQVITVLRLFQEGIVEIENVYCWPVRLGQWHPHIGNRGKIHKRFPYSNTYGIRAQDASTLKEIHRALRASGNNRSLRTAIDRINYASQRNSASERLVDAAIALEAIYGDGRGAATYKVAIRCAAYLENDVAQRIALMNEVDKIYSLRSSVVHGSTSTTKFGSLEENANLSLELARRSTRKLLDGARLSGAVPKPNYFDELLLGAPPSH